LKKFFSALLIALCALAVSNCTKTSPTQAAVVSKNMVQVEIIDSINWAGCLIYANNTQIAWIDSQINISDSTFTGFPVKDTFFMVPDSSKLTALDVDYSHDTIATAGLVWVLHN